MEIISIFAEKLFTMRKDISRKVRFAALMAVFAFAMTLVSCKKDNGKITIITPNVPENVLPTEVKDEVKNYMDIYEGENPPHLNGQFVSRPHALIHESYNPSYNPEDSTVFYYDRYVAFVYSETNGLDFYGKQLDSVKPNGDSIYYEEHVSKLKITGTGNNFSCYYDTEGYPDGMYAKQSTIFSGKWDEKTGIIDFKVAVVLVETSGNPNLQPKNSFRVLGDFDGVAKINNWMGAKSSASTTYDSNCAFKMFRKKK